MNGPGGVEGSERSAAMAFEVPPGGHAVLSLAGLPEGPGGPAVAGAGMSPRGTSGAGAGARAEGAGLPPGGTSAPAGRVVGAILDALQGLATEDSLEELEVMAVVDSASVRQVAADLAVQMEAVDVSAPLAALKREDQELATVLVNSLMGLRRDQTLAEVVQRITTCWGKVCTRLASLLGLMASVELDEEAESRARRRAHCVRLLEGMLKHRRLPIRVVALDNLARCGWSSFLDHVRQMLSDDAWEVRQKAVEMLGRNGRPAHLPLVLRRFKDKDEDVRASATKAAVVLLEKDGFSEEGVDMVIQALRKARGGIAKSILDLLAERTPGRFLEAAAAAASSPDWNTRCAAARKMARAANPEAVPLLLEIVKRERDEDVLRAALRGLGELDPERAAQAALGKIDHRHWKVREAATWCLGKIHDPALVDRLIPRARDKDEDVRRVALVAMAKYDDERVLGELISSLNDTDKRVQAVARELLEGGEGPLPALERVNTKEDDTPYWERVTAQVAEITLWGERLGRMLLGKPVIIHQYRQGLGRTGDDKKAPKIEMEVSDTPLTSGHPYGADIMRGLILHELGHHLYDVPIRGHKTMRGIAHSQGVGQIYDILRDERLERKLRSRNDGWGRYLDRLASYAFAQGEQLIPVHKYAELVERDVAEMADAIASGELPGRLLPASQVDGSQLAALTARESLQVPGLVSPLMLFLACLRCRFDAGLCPDPKVVEAVAVIPANLKDLPHRKVLKVALAIGDLIGRSEKHKKDWEQMMRRLRQLGLGASIIERAIRRLTGTGEIPEWVTWGEGRRQRRRMLRDLRRRKRERQRRRRRVPVPPPIGGRRHKEPSGEHHPDLNLNPEQDFTPLPKEVPVEFDAERNAALVASIRKHIRKLRSYFERLGMRTVEEYASRRGRRLDMAQARKAALVRSPNMLVFAREEISPNAYLGVLIDRSGSMEGEKLERAQAFGALVCESARRLPGIEGHVNAFDDDTWYVLGDFQKNSIASLRSGGRNNDSGALMRAAELALLSRKRNKLIIMISDGAPTECTFESLRNLVVRLGREYGVLCAQVAVDSLEEVAFPHFVDLSRFGAGEAVSRFGKMVMGLTGGWR